MIEKVAWAWRSRTRHFVEAVVVTQCGLAQHDLLGVDYPQQ